jgi:hypothetical protein
LPGKSWDFLGFQPLREAAFEDFDHLGYILGARELEESMHVISGAADSDGRTLNSAKNATEIGVSGLEQFGCRETGSGLWSRK